MRILHTSDWHLGRSLHGLDLLSAQREFCDSIVAIAETADIDCTLIVGDIFDKALAPVEAIRLFSDTLDRLAQHCTVIVTSGNHDSAIRLGAGSRLYRDGIHVVTEASAAGAGIDVVARGVTARIYPVPYLDPDHSRHALAQRATPLPRSHEAVMAAAVRRMDAFDETVGREVDVRIVAAHAFVLGGVRTESERDIAVGGVDAVPSAVFAGFDYVALGHLHGPQEVRGVADTVIRYSGSPLRYSFSEGSQSKSVTIVSFDKNGVSDVELVEIEQPRPMVTLRGRISDLMSVANIDNHRDSWVRLIATDPARPQQLLERVRAAFPHALSVVHQPERPADTPDRKEDAVDLRDPVTVSRNFIRHVTAAEATESEVAVLRDAYEIARAKDAD